MKKAKAKKTGVGISKTYLPPSRGKQPPIAEPEEVEEKPKERIRKRVEAPSKRDLTKESLLRVAREAYEGYNLPDFIEELAEQLTLDDIDVFWEFASLVHSPDKITDFYVAIKEELALRIRDGNLQGGKIPHYYSLSFASPALAEQRK